VFLNQGYHSTEVASKTDLCESEHNDDAMTLSEALANINAKEELVKQHIKVAEEAVSGALLPVPQEDQMRASQLYAFANLDVGLPPENKDKFTIEPLAENPSDANPLANMGIMDMLPPNIVVPSGWKPGMHVQLPTDLSILLPAGWKPGTRLLYLIWMHLMFLLGLRSNNLNQHMFLDLHGDLNLYKFDMFKLILVLTTVVNTAKHVAVVSTGPMKGEDGELSTDFRDRA
ncbi:mediator of RNA polymerase II transcription subunit 4-like protein, partial [Tanacetum coccineum]